MALSGPADAQTLYTRKVMEAVIRIAIVALLALWSFQIFSPFLGPVVWGMIIAVACFRIFTAVNRALGNRRGLSATLFAVFLLAVLIAPTIFLSESLLTTTQAVVQRLDHGDLEVPPPPKKVADWPLIGDRVYENWQLANRSLAEALDRFRPQIETVMRKLLARALGAGVDILLFALSIILAAIFLAHAEAAARTAKELSVRLAGERGSTLVALARDTISSVARGVLGIAVIQTFFLSIGLIAAGVPAAGLLSFIALLVAVAQIPMLLLFLPIIGYVFATSTTGVAVLFAVWSVFFSFADGFLKPVLLGRGLTVPMPVILIGVIGGMISNGIIGLFVGPIVLAFSYKLFMVWLRGEPGQAPA